MTPARRRYIAYYRVSTRRQGHSGLGLDKQQTLVEQYLNRTGGRLLKSFTEVESGRKAARPQLQLALQACRAYGSTTLIVASFDRLSRDAALLLTLKSGNVPIISAEMPDVGEAIVGMMAVVAQMEARWISERTKGALREARKRGVRLGTPANLSARDMRAGRSLGRATVARRAREYAEDLRSTFDQLEAEGLSLRGKAHALTAAEVATPQNRRTGETNGTWTPTQVARVRRYLQR